MELKVTHNQFQDPLSPSNIITHKTGVCGSSPQWPILHLKSSSPILNLRSLNQHNLNNTLKVIRNKQEA